LELIRTSSEQFIAEFYAVVLEERFEVALEMSEGENLFLAVVSKLKKEEEKCFIIFKCGWTSEGGVVVQIHALKTMTEQFQLCHW
jgi:hypothetical protein